VKVCRLVKQTTHFVPHGSVSGMACVPDSSSDEQSDPSTEMVCVSDSSSDEQPTELAYVTDSSSDEQSRLLANVNGNVHQFSRNACMFRRR